MITEALRWKFPAAKEQREIEVVFQQSLSLSLSYTAVRRINLRVPEVLCKNHSFSYCHSEYASSVLNFCLYISYISAFK